MKAENVISHLFRTEFSRIVATLCRYFGTQGIEKAEDIASETLMAALNTWSYKGVPENPEAWLHRVAKNKAINVLKKEQVFAKKIAASYVQLQNEILFPEEDWSTELIRDSELRMMFVICHPSISKEAQVGLCLRILCGFGIEEIATAFCSNKETISKRLLRAKKILKKSVNGTELPGEAELQSRTDSVLTTIYLLFNEGYYSESNDSVLREELCYEAIKLAEILLDQPAFSLPSVHALYALMCFHASRFAARKSADGEMLSFRDQDRACWDQSLITKGAFHLHKAANGDVYTPYHLEAAIAYWFTTPDSNESKWKTILQLYDHLLVIKPIPVVQMNRLFAYSKVHGAANALTESESFTPVNNHFYHVLMGELNYEIDHSKAIAHFNKAFSMARADTDRMLIQQRLNQLIPVNGCG